MISSAYVRSMAQYNGWMNRKVYEAAAELPDDERKRERGAYFGSIHRTLDHILFGDRAWLGRFTGHAYDISSKDGHLYEDFAELLAARRAMDDDILAFAETVTDAWLAGETTWTSGMDGLTRSRPNWALVAHMFNHQTHHRGQVATLLSQLGADIGSTDLPWAPFWDA
ncbi:MAG: DinB family protein [Pseudomonadota bacterium]